MDTQDFSEQALGALGVAVRLEVTLVIVVGAAAIAGADIEVALVAGAVAEADPVKVVTGLRLIGSDYRHFAPWIGDVGISADRKARDVGYAVAKKSVPVGRVADLKNGR